MKTTQKKRKSPKKEIRKKMLEALDLKPGDILLYRLYDVKDFGSAFKQRGELEKQVEAMKGFSVPVIVISKKSDLEKVSEREMMLAYGYKKASKEEIEAFIDKDYDEFQEKQRENAKKDPS